MTENAETTAKPAKKRAAKKATARKPAAKKATARKAPAKKRVAKKAAAPATAKRGRPPGKKAARKTTARRGKKAKQFAYQLLTAAAENGEPKASAMNGPFSTEADALDDASIMADDSTTIVLFREAKRGRVQKSTKFVAGR